MLVTCPSEVVEQQAKWYQDGATFRSHFISILYKFTDFDECNSSKLLLICIIIVDINLLVQASNDKNAWKAAKSIYEFSAKDIDGNEVSLDKYRLVVYSYKDYYLWSVRCCKITTTLCDICCLSLFPGGWLTVDV